MRTACYARFSSDQQRTTSADDQIRVCRDYAERQDWTWQEAHEIESFADNRVS